MPELRSGIRTPARLRHLSHAVLRTGTEQAAKRNSSSRYFVSFRGTAFSRAGDVIESSVKEVQEILAQIIDKISLLIRSAVNSKY